MKTDPNSPAFPAPSESVPKEQRGLTKREYFAAQAMAGLLSLQPPDKEEALFIAAVISADILIKRLNK